MRQDEEAQNELRRRYSAKINSGKWNEIAKELNVNRGDLWQVWYGKSRSNKLRKALGLSKLETKIMPCGCDKIHVHGCKIGKQIKQQRRLTIQQIKQRRRSTKPEALRAIQEIVVPWLREREAQHGK